jgi:hypothetical protein
MFVGCDDAKNGNGNAISGEDDVTLEKTAATFKAITIKPSPFGQWYIGYFLFINETGHTIRLPGYEKPMNGKFTPPFVDFEIQHDDKWETLGLRYCGTGSTYFDILSNNEYEFMIDMQPLKNTDTPLTARVKLENFRSESFTLDWEKDRREGNFRLAREAHINKVRTAFEKSGFLSERIGWDDFCRRFLQSLLMPLKSNISGFDAFEGSLDVLPRIDKNGSIVFSFHSDKRIGLEYQYDCIILLNPSTFSPKWFRQSYSDYIKIGTWGNARLMELKEDMDVPYTQRKLYIEIKYRTSQDDQIPGSELSREVFHKMLTEFESWLCK